MTEGKPSPAPCPRAAELLGADPRDCLVIEDAPPGVRAGLAAGTTVWGVNTADAADGAHRHFSTLAGAAPEILAFARGAAQAVSAGTRAGLSAAAS
ncbi:HAD family phosphatase [Streptomyces sp. NPDC006529]|uniref:HAD family phosphatase n=1 Tax=Streptomyces sp. NPDC006529 TaxID=3157177 RepID=UPI0033B17A0C